MKRITMVEFRRYAEKIISQVQKGERMILTRRGKPVARLEPIRGTRFDADDPFYTLGELAEPGGNLTNRQIDKILYGQ